MTSTLEPRRMCLGYGEFRGTCQNIAGTRWTPYWCERCDAMRREHITAQLKGLARKRE